jgi:hypothetical protein
MWVIFQKSDRKVVGLSADVDTDPDKDKALQEVVKGLAGSPDASLFDAFQVKERGKGHQLAQSISRGLVTVDDAKGGGGALVVTDNEPDVTVLLVTTNAKDFHPVDKVPLLTGDGQSFLVVTVQKTDDQGKALTRKTKDNDTIWLRTTNGTLREDLPSQGAPRSGAAAADVPAREIRSIQLTAGTATFRIYSENARRLATVTLLPTDPSQRGAVVQVEFT